MTYVITQSCCNDASCVAVCPVNCIHPTPDEPGYHQAEMLYIDPGACIDCVVCAAVVRARPHPPCPGSTGNTGAVSADQRRVLPAASTCREGSRRRAVA